MKKIICLLFVVAALFSCATTKEYRKLALYVNENNAAELSKLIDNTKPAKIKLAINMQDFAGRTLLHKAVLLESPEIVEKLLSADADKTVKDNSKYTAADYAESARNEKIRLLFGFFKEKPVKPQAAEPEKSVEAPKPEKKQATVTKDFYSYNVILGVPGSEFLKAVKSQDYKTVNQLLKNGKNVNEVDINSNNALFYTLASGNNAILNLLLSYGINVNYPNVHGQLPLLYAVNKSDRSSISAILDAGANINQQDTMGINAVMLAVFSHNVSMLKFLHAKGASLTGEDSFGNTLLHIAIKNEDLAVTRYLLENGCDVYEPNDKKVTPLSLLKNAKRIEFRDLAKDYE